MNNRRNFVKLGVGGLFFGSMFVSGFYFFPRLQAKTNFLRPPGALDEKYFLATCIKCGQCVQVCPYHSLSLLDINTGNSLGTPYIDVRQRGCYLCDLLPCILACPSGSLNHSITDSKDVKMGIAVLKNPDRCLALLDEKVTKEHIKNILTHSNKNEREAKVLEDMEGYVGNDCSICADLCPYPQKERAIKMIKNKQDKWYPEIRSECVGCGVCEELCPSTQESAIVIIPRVSYKEVYS